MNLSQCVYLHEDTLIHIFSDISLDLHLKLYEKTKHQKISWMISYKQIKKYYNVIKLLLLNIQQPLKLMAIYLNYQK